MEIRLNTAIQEVRSDPVILADGEDLPSDVTVWAAGVSAPAEVADWQLPQGRGGRTAAAYYVEDALGMWEPRIRVLEVTAGPDPDSAERLLISIRYEVKATHDSRSLVFPFYRIPGESETDQHITVKNWER